MYIFPLIVAIIVAFLPASSLPRYLTAVGLFMGGIFLLLVAGSYSIAAGFGVIFLSIFIPIGIATRFLFCFLTDGLWKKWGWKSTFLSRYQHRLLTAELSVLSACAGIVSTLILLCIVVGDAHLDVRAWIAHTIFVGVPIALLFVSAWGLFSLRSATFSDDERRSMRVFCVAVIVTASVAAPVALWHMFSRMERVVGQAVQIAGETPYCLQTGSYNGMVWSVSSGKEISTRLDLSPLVMRADCRGMWDVTCHGFHAILVVDQADGRKLYNWSYRKNDFDPLTVPAAVACTPQTHFLDMLPTFH